MPGIIVGVDGSGYSQHALEWAVTEAAIRHAPLTVITVYQAAAGYWGSRISSQTTLPRPSVPARRRTKLSAKRSQGSGTAAQRRSPFRPSAGTQPTRSWPPRGTPT